MILTSIPAVSHPPLPQPNPHPAQRYRGVREYVARAERETATALEGIDLADWGAVAEAVRWTCYSGFEALRYAPADIAGVIWSATHDANTGALMLSRIAADPQPDDVARLRGKLESAHGAYVLALEMTDAWQGGPDA